MKSESQNMGGLETVIGYVFEERSVLLESLTHSSYSNELSISNPNDQRPNNERLEFLGDAVIGLVVARLLMDKYPEASEGRLSRWRSQLVSRKTLAQLASEMGMGAYLLLGKGEKRTGGADKRSILAGVMEAVVGAMYQDAGLDRTQKFLAKVFAPLMESLYDSDQKQSRLNDKKTMLQEYTQAKHKRAPEYQVVDTWGPEHQKRFRVEIRIEGEPVAKGEGRSKKEAEQHAASLALELLEF